MRGKTSLQFKFSMSYILIILAVLVLLNTYPLLVSQSLVFRTKETAMKSSVKMVESALSGLPELTEENVGQALASVEETGVSRLLVTDTSGCILFDTREGGSAKGMYAMYTEIVQALDGSDAFYCRYDSHAFLSRGASPVVYRNRIIGAVYAYEYDTQQAELLQFGVGFFIHPAGDAADAIQGVIVENDELAIGGEVEVEFDAVAGFHSAAEGGKAIFRDAILGAVQTAVGVAPPHKGGHLLPGGGIRAEEQQKQQEQCREDGQQDEEGFHREGPLFGWILREGLREGRWACPLCWFHYSAVRRRVQ